jgi:hypothetical protein
LRPGIGGSRDEKKNEINKTAYFIGNIQNSKELKFILVDFYFLFSRIIKFYVLGFSFQRPNI